MATKIWTDPTTGQEREISEWAYNVLTKETTMTHIESKVLSRKGKPRKPDTLKKMKAAQQTPEYKAKRRAIAANRRTTDSQSKQSQIIKDVWANKEHRLGVLETRRKNSKTGILGVTWDDKYQKYRVQIQHEGKSIYLGTYRDLQCAIAARMAAEELYKK